MGLPLIRPEERVWREKHCDDASGCVLQVDGAEDEGGDGVDGGCSVLWPLSRCCRVAPPP